MLQEMGVPASQPGRACKRLKTRHGVTEEDVDAMADCDVCAQSKLTKQPHNTRGLKERKRAKGINFVVHTDSMTRTVPSLLKKHTMIQVFIDEHTRYGWVEFFKGKTYNEFSDMLARAEMRLLSGPDSRP